ncbi:MAG: dCTP deaminase [Planctomycetaceae bacterium]|nr:dCTP deaminase [Planctomycetaceae bacterium]
MILSDNSLTNLAISGLVKPFIAENVQGSSIDLTLGETIKVEAPVGSGGKWFDTNIKDAYDLAPGEFILAHTEETITIPSGCSAMVLLRSSAARAGYEHSLAGWCDPGFKGQLTLELRNNCRFHHLPVQAGMRLCQLIVHKLDESAANPYSIRGNYQGQTGVTASNDNFTQVAA